jgi:hypothetical protein
MAQSSEKRARLASAVFIDEGSTTSTKTKGLYEEDPTEGRVTEESL